MTAAARAPEGDRAHCSSGRAVFYFKQQRLVAGIILSPRAIVRCSRAGRISVKVTSHYDVCVIVKDVLHYVTPTSLTNPKCRLK